MDKDPDLRYTIEKMAIIIHLMVVVISSYILWLLA